MRVLFTLLPARGSLQPLLPIAFALRAAGHDVAFVSAARFRSDHRGPSGMLMADLTVMISVATGVEWAVVWRGGGMGVCGV